MLCDSSNILQKLLQLTTQRKLCVGYSGGVDSHVLLHLLAQQQQFSVRVLHINHGLSPNALAWQQHCATVCSHLNIEFTAISLQLTKNPGDSLEEVAREARYKTFLQQIQPDECLVTAHNADDQAETVLLQLIRGAGVAGLAAMPEQKIFGVTQHLRPLLTISRVAIEEYATQHQLHWINDESNASLAFDRNYLRHRVMPLLKQRWPQLHTTLARSARHCAKVKSLQQDIAITDLQHALVTPTQLNLQSILCLSAERQHQALRLWLKQQTGKIPSEKQLQTIFTAVIHAKLDATPEYLWQSQLIRRYKQRLYLCSAQSINYRDMSFTWDLTADLILPQCGTVLSVKEVLRQGLSLDYVGKSLTLRFRRGGEKIKLPGATMTRSLKKILQERDIPPWQREQIPLLYDQEQLLFVIF